MKIALIGNPNSGKTTLFNQLTGSSAHVGNWPGVTVEKHTGYISQKGSGEKIEVVDLPGLYSLSPYSPEELVTRSFLLDENPDLLIDIVDATNLERNLYLTTQLMELDIPIVVALNMGDVLKRRGVTIDVEKLSSALGLPVFMISARKKSGIKELLNAIPVVAKTTRTSSTILLDALESKYSNFLHRTWHLLHEDFGNHTCFHAVKFFEGDSVEINSSTAIAVAFENLKKELFPSGVEEDFEEIVADARYNYIVKNYSIFLKKENENYISKSERADKIITHKIFGIPIFLLIMFSVFHLTFSSNLLFLGAFIPDSFEIPFIAEGAINSPGAILFSLMESFTDFILESVASLLSTETWYGSLIVDGVLSGICSVLSFVPQIVCLYFLIGILEDVGYMTRAAFIMDRAFRKLGLSGKVFMPFLMCFGCAVPGIASCKTLEDPKVRSRAILLTPFFSCGAKLPIWAAFAGVFASAKKIASAEFLVYSIYLLGIVVAVLGALILKKWFFKGDAAPFILELPSYHRPTLKNLLQLVWEKVSHYLYKCATIITLSIVVIWFLSTFSFTFKMVEDGRYSILGTISRALSFIFVPLGFGFGENGWKFVVAAFTGLIAKEMVVATLGSFSGAGEIGDDIDVASPFAAMMLGIGGQMFGLDVALPALFSYMAFNLLSVPCMAAIAMAKSQLGRGQIWKAVLWWMSVAYIVSLLIYWSGTLIIYLTTLF